MIDKPKWTEGPWEVRVILGHSRVFSTITGLPVADAIRSEDAEREEPEVTANCHLISAAPELYAVVEKALVLHDECYCDDPEDPTFDSRDRCIHCVLTAALSKARGEA